MISICDYTFIINSQKYHIILFYAVYFSGKRKDTKGNTGNVANEPSDETIAGCLIALLSLAGSVRSAVQSMMI